MDRDRRLPWQHRVLPVAWRVRARRTLMTVFGLQLLLAVVLTLVDSYRRRGKRPKPFPTTPPRDLAVGEGTVRVYTYGEDLYADMLAAIEQAEHQVLLETYIWKADDVGERFKRALYAAADRGVDVYVVYDGFANLVVSPRFLHFRPPVRVLRYPVYTARLRFFDLSRYGRDHRKILVVDGTVGFVGGYNIGEAYAREWRDTHVRITGPGVWDLKRTFADFWNLNRRGRTGGPLLLDTPSDWEPRIRVHRNVPRLWMFPIRAMYLEAINRATHNVWLTQAYFIPDPDFVAALRAAALRGVDVRVLLPRTSNHIVADWISRGWFSEMLSAGIKIYRFRDAMVHAKTATVDGAWSTVGTANIDRLSMSGNYEVNVEVIDPQVAATMERIFRTDLRNCDRLTEADWARRGLSRRAVELFLGPLRPLL